MTILNWKVTIILYDYFLKMLYIILSEMLYIRTEYNSIISQVVTDNNTMVNETAEQTVNKLCWYIINFIRFPFIFKF